MQTQLFTVDGYVTPGTSFHFARKRLEARVPRVRHWHDYHEVFLVEAGSVLHWMGDEPEILPRGALVFIRPEDCHALSAADPSGARIVNVVFRSETAEHLLSRYGDDLAGRFFWREGPVPETVLLQGPRLERAVNTSLELQTAKRSLARIEEYLLTLMTRVVDASLDPDAGIPPWLQAACAAAREPEVFRRGASGFVAAAGRGHEHVCRMARRHLGLSPTDYVNRLRMEHAAMLLAGTDLAIGDVAGECGFANLGHFYRLFGAQYGTTPRAYRQRHARDPVRGIAS